MILIWALSVSNTSFLITALLCIDDSTVLNDETTAELSLLFLLLSTTPIQIVFSIPKKALSCITNENLSSLLFSRTFFAQNHRTSLEVKEIRELSRV